MKKIPVRTLYLLLVIGIGLIGLGIGSTYAIFTTSAEISNPISLGSNLSYDGDVMETVEVVIPAGETISTTLNVTNSSNENLNYSVWYVTSSNDILAGTSSGTPTGSLASGASTSVVVGIRNSGSESVTVILGISSSSDSVVVGNDMKIVPSEELKPLLTTYINNLYSSATKTTVTNNSITYNYARIYDNDTDPNTSGGLMNDRLGGTTTDYDAGNIRYYGASPNNYIDIGDAYTKDTTVNNWEEFGAPSQEVCYDTFDCSVNYENMGFEDENSCNTGLSGFIEGRFGVSTIDEVCGTTVYSAGEPKSLYRIIGLFKNVELSDGTKKDLVKVIRDNSIGDYSWNQSPSDINNGWGINEWSQADLMKLLNPGYTNETIGGSLYWNSNSGSCYGYDNNNNEYTNIPCDFTSTGLNSDVHNKIEEVKWNLGGHNSNEIYPNQIYEYERGETVYQIGSSSSFNDTIERTTVWPGKVALAYPSDYGYSVDLNSCNKTLVEYYDSSCTENNWMYERLTFNGMSYSWLLTPNSSDAYRAWDVDRGGHVTSVGPVHYNQWVSPVFYLTSELVIVTGSGSEATPYVVR